MDGLRLACQRVQGGVFRVEERLLQFDAALGAHDEGFAWLVDAHAAGELGAGIGIDQGQAVQFIHAGWSQMGMAAHFLRQAQQHGSKRDRVDAQVQQRAPGQRRVVEAVSRVIWHVDAEIRRDQPHFADAPCRDPVLHAVDHGEVAHPHRFHQEQAAFPRQGDTLGGLGRVLGEGLFAQHMFTRFQAQAHVVGMMAVRRGDVDHIHVRVGHQCLVAGITPGDVPLRAKGIRAGLAAGADRHQFGGVTVDQRLGHLVGDAAGRHDAPA